MFFNAKALLGALLVAAPLALAQNPTTTDDIPTVTTTTYINVPGGTVTSTLETGTSYVISHTTTTIPVLSSTIRCSTADYKCPGCETTEYVTFSTPCSIRSGQACPTDKFPPMTSQCHGICPTPSCPPDYRSKTHWIQTCTYPAGCPEPTPTYRACPGSTLP
ncbi:hypothetical protein BJ508DRAFT_361934 [Ascobolus immersus RN42]|uniref:Uncharacterized protein n=1 Tax=Ascobolus immersus RN42 TaxID=1160509 RepID=A0A3N4I9L0_ASCIM|nr:hypothetical protein BJ508DRAFT_361934 [Ascobolus immersus RN42]